MMKGLLSKKNDKLYTSYVKENGRVGLSVNDIKTGATIGSEVLLSDWSEVDDHNNASMLLRQDGKIMAFFTAHIREKVNYFRTSLVDEPTQLSDWSPQVGQATSDDFGGRVGATYNNAYQLSAEGGKIYNFMRTNNFNPNIKEYLADGTPVRNGKDQILFQIGSNGSIRPYLKCASNNVDRIDFFFTDGHPVNEENNLYHCYYKTNADGSQGNIYQTDGTFIATMESVAAGTPIPVASVNKLYVFGSDGTIARPWTHNINYDPVTGYPVVTYSKQKNIDQITYHYAKWNGTQWNNYFVSDAGRGFIDLGQDDYTGLITTNPYDTNEIFMSSNKNPITGIENQRYEIYSAITPDGGRTWNWTEVTKNSAQDNLRPYVVKGITNPQDRVVLWFHGDYITYLDYRTRVVGEYINKRYTGPTPVYPGSTTPTNATIAYGVDVNEANGPTLNQFVGMDAVANATATDNGVKFTLFDTVQGSRDRGANAQNNLVRDFVFAPGIGTTTGMRIENLPAGEYTINSFHYDHDYAAPVTVILREQGGPQIGGTIAINNVATPASFTINAEAGKVYEIVATGTTANGTRFNGLSITIPSQTPTAIPCGRRAFITELSIERTGTSASLSFNDLSGARSYEVRTFVKGTYVGGTTGTGPAIWASGTKSPITINNLQPGVEYTSVIRALCTDPTVGSTTSFSIDTDASVGTPPTGTACSTDAEVTGLQVDRTDTSASLSFNELTGVNTYEVRSFVKGTYTSGISGTELAIWASGNSSPITINNLQAGVDYTVVVRAVCSSSVTTKITTIDANATGGSICNTSASVSGLSVNKSGTSATLTFNELDGINTYEVRSFIQGTYTGGLSGTGPAVWASGSGSPITINNLQANSEYTVVVRAICSTNVATQVSTVETNPASAKSIVENNTEKIVVYPNPFTNSLTIKVSKEITNIELFDITSKQVKQLSLLNNKGLFVINTEDFASGMYFLKSYKNEELENVTRLFKL